MKSVYDSTYISLTHVTTCINLNIKFLSDIKHYKISTSLPRSYSLYVVKALRTNSDNGEFCGSHSGTDEDSSLLGRYAVSRGK
jgi:hypothetical protein